MNIRQQDVTTDIKAWIDGIFLGYDMEKQGIHGLGPRVAFVGYDGEVPVGAAVVQLFWGQLHVKNLAVENEYRGRGMATALMERAHAYGRENGCAFAFVETLSYQAQGFYEKMGYAEEFRRPGFASGVSFIYLRKDLEKREVAQ